MANKSDMMQYTYSLPEFLYNRIKWDAEKHGTSMDKEINALISEGFGSRIDKGTAASYNEINSVSILDVDKQLCL